MLYIKEQVINPTCGLRLLVTARRLVDSMWILDGKKKKSKKGMIKSEIHRSSLKACSKEFFECEDRCYTGGVISSRSECRTLRDL